MGNGFECDGRDGYFGDGGRGLPEGAFVGGDFLENAGVEGEKEGGILRVWAVIGLTLGEHVAVEALGKFTQGKLGDGADGEEDEKEGENDGQQVGAAVFAAVLFGRCPRHVTSCAARSSWSRGRAMPKVLPWLGALSTQTRPS